MNLFLHHIMSESGPGWPGNPGLVITPLNQTVQGNNSNVYTVSFANHMGTHMDTPNHYLTEGIKITDLPPQFFIYHVPLLLDIPKLDREKISRADLEPHYESISRCDLLMIRTGFSAFRGSQPIRYSSQGPGMASDTARYLIEEFPRLRSIMIDFLSLASYSDPEDGDEAHKWLLGCYSNRFITPIEDANLGVLPSNPRQIVVLPLLIDKVDSSPVTVLASF